MNSRLWQPFSRSWTFPVLDQSHPHQSFSFFSHVEDCQGWLVAHNFHGVAFSPSYYVTWYHFMLSFGALLSIRTIPNLQAYNFTLYSNSSSNYCHRAFLLRCGEECECGECGQECGVARTGESELINAYGKIRVCQT